MHEPALGLWTFPGGFAEAGELPAETAAREAEEETGLRVAVKDLLAIRAIPERRGLNLYFVFAAQPVGGAATPDTTEFDALEWFDINELRKREDVAQLSLEVGQRALANAAGLELADYRRLDGTPAALYARPH